MSLLNHEDVKTASKEELVDLLQKVFSAYMESQKTISVKDLIIDQKNEVIQRLEADLKAVIDHQIITENGVI